eukprot:11178905-Lingulodinium_polyedra.AAC.1
MAFRGVATRRMAMRGNAWNCAASTRYAASLVSSHTISYGSSLPTVHKPSTDTPPREESSVILVPATSQD